MVLSKIPFRSPNRSIPCSIALVITDARSTNTICAYFLESFQFLLNANYPPASLIPSGQLITSYFLKLNTFSGCWELKRHFNSFLNFCLLIFDKFMNCPDSISKLIRYSLSNFRIFRIATNWFLFAAYNPCLLPILILIEYSQNAFKIKKSSSISELAPTFSIYGINTRWKCRF